MQFWLGVVAGLFTGWIVDYFFNWLPRRKHGKPATVPPPETLETSAPASEITPQHDDVLAQENDKENNA